MIKSEKSDEPITKLIEKAKQAKEMELAYAEKLKHDEQFSIANDEKAKLAAELIIANKELVLQNREKEKRAVELHLAVKELAFQNEEKSKRAAELIIANKELIFQNQEKEKRATELIIANKEKEERVVELINAKEEIRKMNETLEQKVIERTKQLEFANKELESFSYSVSHDLRAPLRHIGGFIDLLNKNNSTQLDTSGLRYLKIITESSDEMGNLIDALLSFSRLSRSELRKTKINSKSIVTRVVKSFSDELTGRTVEINISKLPDALGDEELIFMVWVNLISNALKYSRNERKAVIEIGGSTINGEVIFHIKDNGAGFDMKYVDKLFGVFQRLHKTREFEGIGIGLANVNRIVQRHGGKCWAESVVGKGATFFFSLPIN